MNNFYQKMQDKIKRYSNEQYLDKYIHSEYLTDDGDADIFLNLENKHQLFDSRTIGRQLDIKEDIYNYVEDKTSMLENDVEIHLHIVGIELTSHEKEDVRHMFKEHFAIELYKIQKELIACRNRTIYLIILGILAFICYGVFYFCLDFNFFLEVFVFLFTFSLWEAFDCIIYAYSQIKDEREAICQNLLMNITFDSDVNDEKKQKSE